MAVPAGALDRWAARQRALLVRYYDEAWQRGVANYVPDEDPSSEDEPLGAEELKAVSDAGPGSVAALIARRHRRYVPPREPDPDRKRRALLAASRSIDKMVGEISDVARARPSEPGVEAQSAAAATAAWAKSNAYRLALGAGVVWAAEQLGFAQAASADGYLMQWICAADGASCDECLDLGGTPPMPLEDWPTLPGEGATSCRANCRCTMDYVTDWVWPTTTTVGVT